VGCSGSSSENIETENIVAKMEVISDDINAKVKVELFDAKDYFQTLTPRAIELTGVDNLNATHQGETRILRRQVEASGIPYETDYENIDSDGLFQVNFERANGIGDTVTNITLPTPVSITNNESEIHVNEDFWITWSPSGFSDDFTQTLNLSCVNSVDNSRLITENESIVSDIGANQFNVSNMFSTVDFSLYSSCEITAQVRRIKENVYDSKLSNGSYAHGIQQSKKSFSVNLSGM